MSYFLIPLSRGLVARVDEADFDRYSSLTWYAHDANGKLYAARRETNGDTRAQVYLHRLIMDAPPGVDVDHKDGDTLDNRRSNLRLASRARNIANADRPPSESGFRGVVRSHSRKRPFQARLVADNRIYISQSVESREIAAQLYDAMASRLHGEFARLNLPDRLDDRLADSVIWRRYDGSPSARRVQS